VTHFIIAFYLYIIAVFQYRTSEYSSSKNKVHQDPHNYKDSILLL